MSKNIIVEHANLFHKAKHNIIYGIDTCAQEELIQYLKRKEVAKELGISVVDIDGKIMMKTLINLINQVIEFDNNRGEIHDEIEMEYRSIQSIDFSNMELLELRNYRKRLQVIEEKRNMERPQQLLNVLLAEYLYALIYFGTLKACPNISSKLFEEDEQKVKNSLNCILNGDVEKWVNTSTYSSDILDIFRKQYESEFRIIIKNNQFIADFDLQEIINGFMSNVRVKGFRMNVLTSLDSMYRESFGNHYLENTNDVNRVLYKTK